MTIRFSNLPVVTLPGGSERSGDLPSMLARISLKHGPIFRLAGILGPDVGEGRVFMVGPEANRFVMHSHRDHFSHDLGWTPVLGASFGRGLLNMDDPEHAVHRRMWNPAFAASYMSAYLPVIQQVIADRTSRWPEREQVDLYTEAREIAFDIAAAALAGFSPGAKVDHLREFFYALLHGFDEEAAWEEYEEKILRMQAEVVGMLLAMIDERRRAVAEVHPHDVLSMIVHARDERGQPLSDEQVLGHLIILLVAGHETTTSLGAWALYLLATLPEHRSRLAHELASTLGGGPITVEAMRTMKTLDNFVRETGRLYPPVINVPRGVVKEFEFGGYLVPEGAQIRLSLGACHKLPTVFANPERFDPDRLAPPREEDRRTPYSLVTFGGGPRVCIGQHVAHVEVKALLAHVLRHYRLKPLIDQPPTHAGFFTAIIPGGVPMRVTGTG